MKIKDEILKILSDSVVQGNKLFLTGSLDRKTYVDVNKVLEAAGGKWNKKEKAHIFEKDAEERIDEIITTGEVEIPKDEFNFFPTPEKVVKLLIEMADLEEGLLVLEPSAGRGAIAKACYDAGAVVTCYELMEENYNYLKNQTEFVASVEKVDFLSVPPEPKFDRVVMNPPFMKQNDIKHTLHAYKFLKPGGLLIAVASAGVLFRNDKRTQEFRDFVAGTGGLIEPLPENSFKESGTLVNTCVCTVVR